MLTVRKMAKTAFRNKILIASIFALSACSSLPDWWGSAKNDSGIKGTRIAVLGVDANTNADATLAEVKVLIPRPLQNEKWYKSDGRHYLVPNNPELSRPLTVSKSAGAGKGATDSQHLNASPVVADNKVFTISSDSVISAFDAHNIKKRLWNVKLKLGDRKDRFSAAAGISYYEGKIFATTGYNEVLAIDANSGKIIWTRNINSIARSAPDAKDNIIYVNTIDNRLYAMSATDGSILWTHSGSIEDISMFGSSAPIVYDSMVIAPYSSGEIFAINASDGKEIWTDVFSRRSFSSASTISDIDAPPVASFGKLYVISNDGVLAASDIASGKRLWEQQISGRQSPWVAGDFLYLISNRNELICVYAPTGGIKWVKQLKATTKKDGKGDPIVWSGPVLAGDYLWAVSSDGKLTAFSPRTGDIDYERKVPKDIYIAPVVAYGSVYLYTNDAELVTLSNDGKNKQPAGEENIYKETTEKQAPQSHSSAPVNSEAIKPAAPANSESVLHKITAGTSNAAGKVVSGVKGLFNWKKSGSAAQ